MGKEKQAVSCILCGIINTYGGLQLALLSVGERSQGQSQDGESQER